VRTAKACKGANSGDDARKRSKAGGGGHTNLKYCSTVRLLMDNLYIKNESIFVHVILLHIHAHIKHGSFTPHPISTYLFFISIISYM
jgi:hypothetical protein